MFRKLKAMFAGDKPKYTTRTTKRRSSGYDSTIFVAGDTWDYGDHGSDYSGSSWGDNSYDSTSSYDSGDSGSYDSCD